MIIYVDMDGVLCDFEKAQRQALAKCPDQKWPQAEYGFFANLEPIPGAIDGFSELEAIYGRERVHILTRPSVYNPLSYTEKRVWVERHIGFSACERLNMVPNKNILASTGILLDDIVWSGFNDLDHQVLFDANDVDRNWEETPDRIAKCVARYMNR